MSQQIGPQLDLESTEAVENEIRDLEAQLARAKARLQSHNTAVAGTNSRSQPHATGPHQQPTIPSTPSYDATTHFHLLLADSALPLGSFAFSSGLESYLAHTKAESSSPVSPAAAAASFTTFLALSISAHASTTLPFLLAAHRDPAALPALDDALDAAVVCTVGRRASVAQGRALLALWERSFSPPPPPPSATAAAAAPPSPSSSSSSSAAAAHALAALAALLRRCRRRPTPPSSGTAEDEDEDEDEDDAPPPPAPPAAHLAPLFGAVARALGLGRAPAAHAFLLGHARALAGAAVRAGVLGPYAAQRVLAAAATRRLIGAAAAREWPTRAEAAAQRVPAMDLWVGRHEVLYSRIFNS